MTQRESRPAGNETASTRSKATDFHQRSGVDAWTRRHEASQRVAPLDCGCRDPWICRHTDPPLSDQALDGWRDAALRLLFDGLIPLLPIEVRRALYRRGGPDRVLA
ncbi:hypothetical protein, partial [Mycobacterium sp. ZZG]